MSGRLLSVNVADFRLLMLRGRAVKTGIFKLPVTGPVVADHEGLAGDHIADRRFHGGADKALYAYSAEDYEWWAGEIGIDWEPGLFGENLTVEGVDPSSAEIGERWRIGGALIEVSEPREPCNKLAAKLGDRTLVKRFAKAARYGAYLRVLEPGSMEAGDAIEVVERPGHGITTEVVGRAILTDPSLTGTALEAPALGQAPRRWLEKRLAKAS